MLHIERVYVISLLRKLGIMFSFQSVEQDLGWASGVHGGARSAAKGFTYSDCYDSIMHE